MARLARVVAGRRRRASPPVASDVAGCYNPAPMGTPHVFVSAGEPSGDLHGANLVRALRRLAPGVEVVGLGGPRMRAAGARLLADTSEFGIIGFAPIFGGFWKYLELLSRADRFLGGWRPDVAVTIDCPGFHFLLASRLRARRVPLLWYIPPQLWAWAPWRVRKLKRRYSHVACVLPHEQRFFEAAGVPTTFVGHPVIDHLRGERLDEAFIATLRDRPGQPLVALMPGSRRQEVGPILERQLQAARAIRERRPEVRFVVPLAEPIHAEWARPVLAAGGVEARVVVGRTHEVESAADLALVASGTATLELTYFRTPMAVFYNVSAVEWNLLGRWLVTTPYLSLPNAIAGREVVPEMTFNRPLTEEETRQIVRLLVDEGRRARMREDLARLQAAIEKPGSSENAARAVLGLVGSEVPPASPARPGFAL